MNIDQFRIARSEDLKVAAKLIEAVIGGDINTTPINLAAEQIKKIIPALKDGSTNNDHWGYEIIDFIMPVETTKHIRPKTVNISKIELILNMKLIANFKDWDNLNDPFVELNFNVVIRGVSPSGEHFSCFHVDKHDMTKIATEPHPVYHIQYLNNAHNSASFNYGDTLQLDTPRVMHHPIDFILGLGFLTNNFYPSAHEYILEDGYFTGLYGRYQEKIMKPYFHTIAKHWDYNIADITWKPVKDICPFIV